MTFKEVRNNKFIKFFSNRYMLILIGFIVWMVFFDENSYLIHHEFDEEIEKLETDKEYYQTEIESDKNKIDVLEDSVKLDKYAREKYEMKKENEEIYIIEYDTIK